VKDFEPRMALDGGQEGLDFFRALVCFSKDHLKPDGFMAVEIAENQGEAVVQIFCAAGFTTRIKKDYAGLDRVVFASKN
jgi:release factor glutamine methyltransferase